MRKKEEFQKVIDSVLNRYTQSKDLKGKFYIDTEEILHMFMNLNERIEEQRENMHKLTKRIEGLEENLKLLTKELVKSGYIKIGEKRNYLKRNIHSLEAIITLLNKKHIINKKEWLYELKKNREKE